MQGLNAEQLRDLLARRYSYAEKIKAKIKIHGDNYAEGQFNDLIKIGKVQTRPSWSFPKAIVPGTLGASIGNSLYEREASMNNFETNVIADISSLPNVEFWHRNLGRGKGFSINGFKSNHYPDFIIVTRTGNIIILETKGDDRDNPDSTSKRRLGNKWADLGGRNLHYFMVYDKISPKDAFDRLKAKDLIARL